MSNLNSVTLQGRLVRDPELRTLASGTSLVNITVANETGYKDNKRSNFIDCTGWGASAEALAQFFNKGDGILINGELQMDTWETQQGEKRSKLSVRIVNWYFQQGKSESTGSRSSGYSSASQRPAPDRQPAQRQQSLPRAKRYEETEDDEVPF